MENTNARRVELPDALKEQFKRVERRLWRVETMVAVGLALCALLASYFAVFFLDRLWDTPLLVRALVSLTGFAVFGFAAYRWYRNWVFRRRDKKFLAALVQRRFRRLGDRLLSIVELSDEKQHPGDYSEELYRAAIRQVAEEASEYNFEETVQETPVRKYKIALAAFGVVLLLMLFSAPKAVVNSFQRWISPGSNVERFTLVEFSGFPEEMIVPHGEAFSLSGEVNYSTIWKPSRARFRFEEQVEQVAEVNGQSLGLDVPGVTEDGNLNIKLGDAEREVAIAPVYRPTLRGLTARKILPEYLGYPDQVNEVLGGMIPVLEGSRVVIEGETSRPLGSANLRIEGRDEQSLEAVSRMFRTQPLSLDGVFQLTFDWEDVLGLKSAAPWTLTVQSKEDQTPEVDLQNLPGVITLLETEILDLELNARDDYGVSELGLRMQTIDASAGESDPMHLAEMMETSLEADVDRVFQFSPALQKIPAGSVVQLQGFATDFFPDREPSLTAVYQIHVISIEEHAEMLRGRMEALLLQLDEVSRLEEMIADETGNLSVEALNELEDGKHRERIEELEDAQRGNAEELEQLAREGMETLRDALRNPAFSEDTLREWMENLSQMNSLAEQQMQQAASQLQSAASSSENVPRQLQEALETEEEVLDALTDLRQDVNQDLDRLQAMTLSQRLRLLGKQENAIAENLKRIVPQTIGLLPEELSDRLKARNESISADQLETRGESVDLRDEISRFAERTQMDNYQAVSEEMRELETDVALEALSGRIRENRAMISMQELLLWTGRFNAWADALQPPESENGSGGSGQGGGGGEDERARQIMEMLISLLRLREGEMDLRVNTRLLNADGSTGETFVEKAAVLEEQQRSYSLQMTEVRLSNPVDGLTPVLDETQDSMQRVLDLLALPVTNEITDQAEQRTIALLSDSINLINEFIQQNGSGGSQQQQASSEQMAFLLQMMLSQGMGQGMSPNPAGGGNMSGGEAGTMTTGLNTDDAQGNESEERTIERAAGTTRTLPAEFQDALQNYFNAMEREGM